MDINRAGDMKVCLDNTFSHFASKMVFFELISEEEDEDEDDMANWDGAREEVAAIMDMTLEDFKVRLFLLNFEKQKHIYSPADKVQKEYLAVGW